MLGNVVTLEDNAYLNMVAMNNISSDLNTSFSHDGQWELPYNFDMINQFVFTGWVEAFTKDGSRLAKVIAQTFDINMKCSIWQVDYQSGTKLLEVQYYSIRDHENKAYDLLYCECMVKYSKNSFNV